MLTEPIYCRMLICKGYTTCQSTSGTNGLDSFQSFRESRLFFSAKIPNCFNVYALSTSLGWTLFSGDGNTFAGGRSFEGGGALDLAAKYFVSVVRGVYTMHEVRGVHLYPPLPSVMRLETVLVLRCTEHIYSGWGSECEVLQARYPCWSFCHCD